MKRAEFVDIFENIIRAHAMLEGSRSHIPQSQASEQCFDARVRIEHVMGVIRKELKK